ncbi:phage late control protein GPD [compost metagenome]
MGRPDLIPELTYTLEGVKTEIDEIIWYGGHVQHTLSADNGYTVSLALESKLPEDTVEDLAVENQGDFTGIIAFYRDKKTGKEKAVTAGDQSKPRRLRWLYATEKTAKRAVDRELRQMKASSH